MQSNDSVATDTSGVEFASLVSSVGRARTRANIQTDGSAR